MMKNLLLVAFSVSTLLLTGCPGTTTVFVTNNAGAQIGVIAWQDDGSALSGDFTKISFLYPIDLLNSGPTPVVPGGQIYFTMPWPVEDSNDENYVGVGSSPDSVNYNSFGGGYKEIYYSWNGTNLSYDGGSRISPLASMLRQVESTANQLVH